MQSCLIPPEVTLFVTRDAIHVSQWLSRANFRFSGPNWNCREKMPFQNEQTDLLSTCFQSRYHEKWRMKNKMYINALDISFWTFGGVLVHPCYLSIIKQRRNVVLFHQKKFLSEVLSQSKLWIACEMSKLNSKEKKKNLIILPKCKNKIDFIKKNDTNSFVRRNPSSHYFPCPVMLALEIMNGFTSKRERSVKLKKKKKQNKNLSIWGNKVDGKNRNRRFPEPSSIP